MLLIVLCVIVITALIESISFVMYRSNSLEGARRFYDNVLGRKRGLDDARTFTLRYSEHPFLAFTMNPEFKNSHGEKIHNKYGFRHKDDFQSIDRGRDLVVYCAGGSSTYCNFIEKNEDTWPGVLESRLAESISSRRPVVVNGAGSGWTTLQSLIRFSSWVDIIKPDLVVVYHGKNDFAPFVNSKLSITEIYPDYSNVMYSLKLDSIAARIPALARYSFTGKVFYGAYMNRRYANILWHIYNQSRPVTPQEGSAGLKRIGPREWEFIMSRYRSFVAQCKARNIPILFVTQKVVSDMYRPYMDEINCRIKSLLSAKDSCFVYDFATDMKEVDGLLHDTIHFTEYGAGVCAKKIAEYINSNIPVFIKESSRAKGQYA